MTSVTFTLSPTPVTVRQTLTVRASSSGSTTPRYRYKVTSPSGVTETPCGGYTSSTTCSYVTRLVGSTRIQVDARDSKSREPFEATAGQTITVLASPSPLPSPSPSPSVSPSTSPTPIPSPVTLKNIDFSGYNWIVKGGYNGPGPNYWANNSDGVFLDSLGQLHLKVLNQAGVWKSSEVYLPSSLGYGTYTFTTSSRIDLTDINLVGAVFLYADDTREFDFEFTRWGDLRELNSQYVVQPYPWCEAGSPDPACVGQETNFTRFDIGIGSDPVVMHRLIWSPATVTFQTIQNVMIVRSWIYSGTRNFVPDLERVHINHWIHTATPRAPSDGLEHDFVIRSFNYFPSY